MAKKKKHPEHVNHERWLVSYADFVTLLFAFFVVMFANSKVDIKKMGKFSEAFREALERHPTEVGHGLLPESRPGDSRDQPRTDPIVKGMSALAEEREAIRKVLEHRAKTIPALGSLKLLEASGELVIRLPEHLLFDVGDTRLHEDGRQAIEDIVRAIAERPVGIRIEGHTDTTPIHTLQFPSNWELSTARATAVVWALINTKLLEPSRIAAAGYGEFRPVAENDSPEGRSQNRRVDLVIVANAKEPKP